MSNVIKSFRVVENSVISKEQETQGNSSIEETLLIEAKKKYESIITTANHEAQRILEEAYDQSEEILSKAYERSKEMFNKAKIEGYDQGNENGNKEGFEKGYNIGYKEGKDDSEKLIKEALDIKESYIQLKNNLLREVEKDIIELVIAIYEKVLYQKVDEDKELILSLVLNGIDNLEISEKLIIIVSQEDYKTVENSKDLILAKASLIDELDIRVNSDMKKGDCMIETSMGSVDVGISSQLDEVRELLYNILSNE